MSLERNGALSTSGGLGLVGGKASLPKKEDIERQAGRFADMVGRSWSFCPLASISLKSMKGGFPLRMSCGVGGRLCGIKKIGNVDSWRVEQSWRK